MKLRSQGNIQKESAKRSGISERHGRRLESNKAITKPINKKRTRFDPLSEFWDQDIIPLLKSDPKIMPITIFEELENKHPEKISQIKLRTLQRRVKEWKILNGNNKEVMFTQRHEPGAMALSDFTKLKNVTITIAGKKFDHLLYHYKLAYSKWCYVQVTLGGESFTALSSGMQTAFERCCGVPKTHRTDSLSAAYNNNSQKEELTANYQTLCNHYNVKQTRNNLGKSHENGSIESSHGHFKRKIEQALIVRGSNDFTSVAAYQTFIDKIVSKCNRRNKEKFVEEQKYLQALPEYKCQEFSLEYVFVSKCSTIRVKKVLYTVPSNLIGLRLKVRIYDNCLELFYDSKKVHSLKRYYGETKKNNYSINYRHIISSLAKKPQAFRGFMWRDKLLPSADYHEIWKIADNSFDSKLACKYIVGILMIAAKGSVDNESVISRYILNEYNKNKQLVSVIECQRKFDTMLDTVPIIMTFQHQISEYNKLLEKKVNYA